MQDCIKAANVVTVYYICGNFNNIIIIIHHFLTGIISTGKINAFTSAECVKLATTLLIFYSLNIILLHSELPDS